MLVTKIIIFSVTEIDTFSYSNQKWPLGHSWLFYDRAGIRMRTSVLNVMNPNFNKVRDDLGNKIMSAKEAEAFYDFASALFNRTFTGSEFLNHMTSRTTKFSWQVPFGSSSRIQIRIYPQLGVVRSKWLRSWLCLQDMPATVLPSWRRGIIRQQLNIIQKL